MAETKNRFRLIICRYGAKMKEGFTLIELLVAVLLIGILTAMALPRYENAVLKTRTASLLPLIRSVSEAQKVYFMAHGRYSSSFLNLNIGMPAGGKVTDAGVLEYKNFHCYFHYNELIGQASYSVYCVSKVQNAPSIEKYFSRQEYICWAGKNDSRAQTVCMSISGRDEPNASSAGAVGYTF